MSRLPEDAGPSQTSSSKAESQQSRRPLQEELVEEIQSICTLERGDLVRVSELGRQSSKRLKDRYGNLGRVVKCVPLQNGEKAESAHPYLYDIEWILGGKLAGVLRQHLDLTSADKEGMTDTSRNRRKRKPSSFTNDTFTKKLEKKKPKGKVSKPKKTPMKSKKPPGKATSKTKASTAKRKVPASKRKLKDSVTTKPNKKQKQGQVTAADPNPVSSSSMDLYERHRREFERIVARLEKVDLYGYFVEDAPPEFDEKYDIENQSIVSNEVKHDMDSELGADVNKKSNNAPPIERSQPSSVGSTDTSHTSTPKPTIFPSHPPYNWDMVRRRLGHGRYILDRCHLEEEERSKLLEPYHLSIGKKIIKPRKGSKEKLTKEKKVPEVNSRVACPEGVNWNLFKDDVLGMCDNAIARDAEKDINARGSLAYSANKIKEQLVQAYERTGIRHMSEMACADDRHKFDLAAVRKAKNNEAAMQSWRKQPFDERKYERLTSDVVCAGLSHVDERIASYELRTNLSDSFISMAYRPPDTGQSEAWMKNVVDETSQGKAKKSDESKERKAALALAADEGVIRAQVTGTMQCLLIAVQDRVMTDAGVLHQPALRSANWLASGDVESHSTDVGNTTHLTSDHYTSNEQAPCENKLSPEIVEQPVWGLDCYTRRNISLCLEVEFDPDTVLIFVEKWLLPAINACPTDLAHNISNAARLLEGLPYETSSNGELNKDDSTTPDKKPKIAYCSQTLLGSAMREKIKASSPPWLKAAANQLRRARAALGPDFFRVHPKGHGSVLLSASVKANTFVTFYRGEVYPSWRWGEKMDAISITQDRKNVKPALPDFYNMALERPQSDPRGYGLLFVDASRKAGHGSSLSHSCDPTCEVRVSAVKGELCLAMTTLRELEMGEELTFDYNAVTESLNEYRSAVCLCGYGKCRGSFLHFATADCYQQVLNRNSPIATRFSSLVKGSMKQVMSDEDEQVLRNHGFLTAAFGAISVNRREASKDGICKALVDSIGNVPVWLRKYVADTLRYIEYERRALPISLLCDHLSSTEEKITKDSPSSACKEPSKPESSFFYFARAKSDHFKSILKTEGFPDSAKGMQVNHAIKIVAAECWKDLSDDKKEYWKEQARIEFDKKKKAFRKGSKPSKKAKLKSKDGKKQPKPEIENVLHSSNISFEDADAEGMSAMEQRIQQLTQTLSRVGRVLDRHRECSFDSENNNDFDGSPSSLRKLVHAPLSVIPDEHVIGWMWKSSNGVVCSLLRCVENAKCARPSLLRKLIEAKTEFASLDLFGDPTNQSNKGTPLSSKAVANSRLELSDALLKLRSILLQDLKEMTKEFRQWKAELRHDSVSGGTSNSSHGVIDEKSTVSLGEQKDDHDLSKGTRSVVELVLDDLVAEVERRAGITHFSKAQIEPETRKEKKDERQSWRDHYSQRFTLQAAADLLLIYAHTKTFFATKAYKELESTSIEVYAREIGNAVPKSIIDESLQSCTSSSSNLQSISDSCETKDKSSSKKNSKAVELCQPNDIVAKVAVKYKGDYILSQLLQWYNGGIGQKQGLPDMLGCTILPSMNGCFSSELLGDKKVKSERKTMYEGTIRPKLMEWFSDPYQRGNPWPGEIRKAFEPRDNSLPAEKSLSWMPFGSPIIDFLVTGDESSIFSVLEELDDGDKAASKSPGSGLLSSVDKGRPAQAVSNWVQCEDPKCLKWRRIPWHVDMDLLPEKFYCKDNVWDPCANHCDAPEENWDDADQMVGSDGKVEGSPVKKGDLPSFKVGARFDVQRQGKTKFVTASVVKVDWPGKRVNFHFSKTHEKFDEWIDFGSPRIAPLHSKVPKSGKKKLLFSSDKSKETLHEGCSQISKQGKKCPTSGNLNNAKSSKTAKHRKKGPAPAPGNAPKAASTKKLKPANSRKVATSKTAKKGKKALTPTPIDGSGRSGMKNGDTSLQRVKEGLPKTTKCGKKTRKKQVNHAHEVAVKSGQKPSIAEQATPPTLNTSNRVAVHGTPSSKCDVSTDRSGYGASRINGLESEAFLKENFSVSGSRMYTPNTENVQAHGFNHTFSNNSTGSERPIPRKVPTTSSHNHCKAPTQDSTTMPITSKYQNQSSEGNQTYPNNLNGGERSGKNTPSIHKYHQLQGSLNAPRVSNAQLQLSGCNNMGLNNITGVGQSVQTINNIPLLHSFLQTQAQGNIIMQNTLNSQVQSAGTSSLDQLLMLATASSQANYSIAMANALVRQNSGNQIQSKFQNGQPYITTQTQPYNYPAGNLANLQKSPQCPPQLEPSKHGNKEDRR